MNKIMIAAYILICAGYLYSDNKKTEVEKEILEASNSASVNLKKLCNYIKSFKGCSAKVVTNENKLSSIKLNFPNTEAPDFNAEILIWGGTSHKNQTICIEMRHRILPGLRTNEIMKKYNELNNAWMSRGTISFSITTQSDYILFRKRIIIPPNTHITLNSVLNNCTLMAAVWAKYYKDMQLINKTKKMNNINKIK